MVDESKPVHVRDIHVECYSPAPDVLELRRRRMQERGMLYPLSEVAALIQVDYQELVERAKKGRVPGGIRKRKVGGALAGPYSMVREERKKEKVKRKK